LQADSIAQTKMVAEFICVLIWLIGAAEILLAKIELSYISLTLGLLAAVSVGLMYMISKETKNRGKPKYAKRAFEALLSAENC